MLDPGSLTGWDWLVLLIGLSSVVFGVWRGLVRTAAGLFAWIGAFVLAPFGASLLASMLVGVPSWVQLALAFLIGFVVIQLGGALLARVVQGVGLGGLDRALGALLGLGRGLAIVAAVATAAVALGFDRSAAWQGALSRPLLDDLVDAVQSRLGERLPRRPAMRPTPDVDEEGGDSGSTLR